MNKFISIIIFILYALFLSFTNQAVPDTLIPKATVSLALNKNTYEWNEPQTICGTIDGFGKVDIYLILTFPDGRLGYISQNNKFIVKQRSVYTTDIQTVVSYGDMFVNNWEIIPGTHMIKTPDLSLPAGNYTWHVGVVSPGKEPVRENLLAYSSIDFKVSSIIPQAISISTGMEHFVILLRDGSVLAYGRLPNYSTLDTPLKLDKFSNIIGIATNKINVFNKDIYAIKKGGALIRWDWSSNSPLEEICWQKEIEHVWNYSSGVYFTQRGGAMFQLDKEPFFLANDINSINVGVDHKTILKSDGTVWAWGNNRDGALGVGSDLSFVDTPMKVLGIDRIIDVSVDKGMVLGLKDDGTVWAWGQYNSIMGTIYPFAFLPPTQIQGLSNIVKISTGGYHVLALSKEGTLWGWGASYYGELGFSSTKMINIPIILSFPEKIVDIKAEAKYSVLLTEKGGVWFCGTMTYEGGLIRAYPMTKIFGN